VNILIVNHYAGSTQHGMEFRPYYLSREWLRVGHSVRILAGSYSHVRSHQPDVADRLVVERVDGIEYHWYPTPKYSGNGIGRIRNIFAFLRQAWRDAPRHAREFAPDVVVASSTYPMDIWVAERIARRASARLLFEVHDLWPLSPIEIGGMSRRHPFIMLCQAAEDYAYCHSDAVVSILPRVGEYMASRGLDLRKLHVVGNGVVADEWQGEGAPVEPTLAAHLDAEHAAGRAVVGFTGSHGVPNALDVVLDAAKLLRDAPVSFVLVGDGMEKARLQRRIAEEHIDNVSMFPPVPKRQIPPLLRRFDIAYIGWQRLPIYRFGIAPNKLMDYMMAGSVVLHSVEAGNDPVGEAGCGLTVAPESPQAVADGVRRLLAAPVEERHAMGERGRQFILRHHTYEVLARRFLEAAVPPTSATRVEALA
jgi:glycosyltransferase involved in cell wall biosynthesis